MSGLHIGVDAKTLKVTLPEMTKALLAILNSGAGDDVKKAAIAALSSQAQVTGTVVQNCHFECK